MGQANVGAGRAAQTHRRGGCVLLVVRMQDEDPVHRPLDDRVDHIVLARCAEHHAQEVPGVTQVVLRVHERLADADYAAQLAVHKRARAVFDRIRTSGLPGLEHFDTLSLGMTADLDAAIAAGSTLVRVEHGLFSESD